jgi:hypothetical protein
VDQLRSGDGAPRQQCALRHRRDRARALNPGGGAHSVRAVVRSRRMSPTLPTRLSSARAARRALPSNWRPEPGSAVVLAFRAGIQRHAPASWTAPVLWRFWTECSSQTARGLAHSKTLRAGR